MVSKIGANCKILWVDDIRKPCNDTNYIHAKSVNEAIELIQKIEADSRLNIGLISMDHDAGDYAKDGGDYIKLLDWLEATGRNYPIHIHSMNIVGVQNMRAIIQHNGWTEIR